MTIVQALWLCGNSPPYRLAESVPVNTVPTSAPVGDDPVVVRNPFDGSVLGRVPRHGPEDVDRACTAAQQMLEANLRGDIFPQHARASTLDRAAVLLDAQSDAFARLISGEAGKPITAARGEVARCIDTLRFSAAEARSLVGEMVPMEASEPGAGRLGFALRVPLGVVAAITPFNFPLNLVAHKVAPAVAADAYLGLAGRHGHRPEVERPADEVAASVPTWAGLSQEDIDADAAELKSRLQIRIDALADDPVVTGSS